MSDGLEDLVELGFEGFDHAIDKFYDKGYDRFSKRKFLRGQKQDTGQPPRARSQPPNEHNRSDNEEEYNQRRRRDSGSRQGGRNASRGRGPGPPTAYYPQPGEYANDRAAQGGKYVGRRQSLPVSQAAQQDPYQAYGLRSELGQDQQLVGGPYPRSAYPQNRYSEQRDFQDSPASAGRRRSVDGARASSPYSDAQYSRSHRQRRRSKSPQGKGLASIVLGALAGGVAGNELNKGDAMTTVAGAVIGAVGAREVEKRREKRKERDRQDDGRKERRRS